MDSAGLSLVSMSCVVSQFSVESSIKVATNLNDLTVYSFRILLAC